MSATPWGVDLSPTYNPTVDAAAIKAAGASYAILKVSEGVGWPGEHLAEFGWFARVAAAVLDAGLELRVYHLATPRDRADALDEALWFDRHLGKLFPHSVAYDLEQLAPGLTNAQHASIFEAWRESVAGFLPAAVVEFYSDRYVRDQLAPFLTGVPVWLGWPGWAPGNIASPLPAGVVRVQIGKRTIPGVAGNVDVNVAPNASVEDVAEALGHRAPTPTPAEPAPTPKPPAPQGNSDWSLTVRTLDLRNAANTPLTGDSVKSLQSLLNLATMAKIPVDGLGGPITQKALLRFQTTHGLAVDGIAGPQTWEALCRQ